MSEPLTDAERADIKKLARFITEGLVNYVQQQKDEELKVTDPEKAKSKQDQIDVMKRHNDEQTRIKQEKRKEKKARKAEIINQMNKKKR